MNEVSKFIEFGKLMGSFSPEGWHALISQYEDHEIGKLDPAKLRKESKEQYQLFISTRPYILRALAHYSIRFAGKSKRMPSLADLHKARHLYIESDTTASLVMMERQAEGLAFMMSRLAKEQFAEEQRHFNPIHMIGRAMILFDKFQDDIFNLFEIDLVNIYKCAFCILCWAKDKTRRVFDVDQIIMANKNILDREVFNRFIEKFAASTDKYNNLYSDGPLRDEINNTGKYPILVAQGDCVVYSIRNMLRSIEALVSHTLHYGTTNYRTAKGQVFESYVGDLLINCNLISDRCENIPGIGSRTNADWYHINNKIAYVFECKASVSCDTTFVSASQGGMAEDLNRRLSKAESQIKSAFEYLNAGKKRGFIICGDHIPFINNHYNFTCAFPATTISVISISELEDLGAMRDANRIRSILCNLSRKSINDNRNLHLSMLARDKITSNPLLEKAYRDLAAKVCPI